MDRACISAETGGVHVVVTVPHVRFDEGVVRELALPGVIEEVIKRREMCREMAVQLRCVDDARERCRAGRIAVDPPCGPLRLTRRCRGEEFETPRRLGFGDWIAVRIAGNGDLLSNGEHL